LLVLFLALVVGPVVISQKVPTLVTTLEKLMPSSGPFQHIFQPVGLDNNDTLGTNHTGTGAVSSAAATPTIAARVVKLF
jgi:hypothetical protein